MTDPITETICQNCEHNPDERTDYCPACGTEDPWTERNRYDFEDVEFPVVIEYESYEDHYGMWKRFCEQVFGQYGLDTDQIANVPSGLPRMKYTVFSTYWKVTEDSIDGPYLSEEAAREA